MNSDTNAGNPVPVRGGGLPMPGRLLFLLVAAVAATLLFSFACAELGCFTAPGSLVFLAAAFAALFAADRKLRFVPTASGKIAAFDGLLLAAAIVFGALVYFPPSEYAIGGWDPGVYTATGASIARTGGIMFDDPLLSGLGPAERRLFVAHRQGGFPELYHGWRLYGGEGGGRLSPQFFHMFPVMQALGHGAGGLAGSLAMSPLLALLGLCAVFALSRAAAGDSGAAAATVVMAVCPVFVWMARFQCSEMPAMFAMACGFVFLFMSRREADGGTPRAALFSSAVSAAWFGIAQLTRADLIPFAAALSGMGMIAAAWPAIPPALRRARIAWTCIMLAFLAHTFLYQRHAAPFYLPLPEYTGRGSAVVLALGAAGALAVVVARRFAERLAAFLRPYAAGAAALGVAGMFFFAVLVWPFLEGSDPDNRRNVLDLGRLVSWPVLVAAAAGAVAMTLRARRFEETAFVVVGISACVVILAENYVEALYPWAARRLLPVVLPFVFISAAACLSLAGRLALRWRRSSLVACLAAGALVVVVAACHRADLQALLPSRDFRDVGRFVLAVGDSIPDPDLVIVTDNRKSGRGFAEALRFHAGVPALALKNMSPENIAGLAEMLQARLGRGENIYLLSPAGDRPALDGITLKPRGSYSWRGEMIGQTRRPFPRAALPRGISFTLYRAGLAGIGE